MTAKNAFTDEIVKIVAGFSIETICGQESTVIVAPELENLMHDSELIQEASVTSAFVSQNPNCIIESVELTSGEGFILTDLGNGQFTVSLNLEKSTVMG